MISSRRIGIMGGTFDPVHIGHLVAAETARDAYGLDFVLFMPAGDPPHKKARHLAPKEARVSMLESAVRDNPFFIVDKTEVERAGTTYTIDTLKELGRKYAGDKLYYIIGGDTLLELHTWRCFEEVSRLCSFIVYQRPGYRTDEVRQEALRLSETYEADVCFAEGSYLDISSSDIRSRVFMNKSIKYLVPDSVESLIRNRHLYKGE